MEEGSTRGIRVKGGWKKAPSIARVLPVGPRTVRNHDAVDAVYVITRSAPSAPRCPA